MLDSAQEEEQGAISMRLPLVLIEELRAVARENDRTLSAEARLALRAWLDKTEKAA